MERHWRRRGRDDADDARADRRERRNRSTRPAEEDIEERLSAVTSNLDERPTAEELRAAFRGRKREPVREPAARAEPDQPSFASMYTTESLFIGPDDDVDPEPEPEPEREAAHPDVYGAYYNPADAWEVLGVDPAADWPTIVAAHRRLALEHHPDRLQDLSAAERKRSEAVMRDVNVAYTILKRLREA